MGLTLCLTAHVKYFRDKSHRLDSLNLRVIVKYEQNEVPSHAQTCDVLYLTFQRLGDRDIA